MYVYSYIMVERGRNRRADVDLIGAADDARQAAGLPSGGARYEVLPFGKVEEQAAQIPEPLRLTVTCSPKHGPERSIALAARLRELGHVPTAHIAARTVRDLAHLDALLAGAAAARIEDIFVIGGDGDRPVGQFESAVELLPLLAGHARRPLTLGIAGYPEGHPLIDHDTLESALATKSRLADYLVTQLCFDAEALRGWIVKQRERGIDLPIWIGVPGRVSAARLLEVSTRVGVGPSLRFVRKQRSMQNLFGLFGGLHSARARRLHRALSGLVEDRELGIAGLQYFTFNQLLATWTWQQSQGQATLARETTPRTQRVGADVIR